jgi:hypothetical protein
LGLLIGFISLGFLLEYALSNPLSSFDKWFELTKAIKSERMISLTPLVLLTSHGQELSPAELQELASIPVSSNQPNNRASSGPDPFHGPG